MDARCVHSYMVAVQIPTGQECGLLVASTRLGTNVHGSDYFWCVVYLHTNQRPGCSSVFLAHPVVGGLWPGIALLHGEALGYDLGSAVWHVSTDSSNYPVRILCLAILSVL